MLAIPDRTHSAPARPLAEPEGVRPAFGTRLRGIEGLRALAALGVLVTHVAGVAHQNGQYTIGNPLTKYVIPSLGSGLTLFFALSGFLLYRPFAAAIIRGTARPAIASFLRNRALRIIPAYWAILLLSAFVLRTTVSRAGGPGHFGVLSASEFVQNMLFVQPLHPGSLDTGIGPAWSLTVEAIFYLLLPLLVLLAARLAAGGDRARRRRAVLTIPVILLAVGVAGKIIGRTALYNAADPTGFLRDDWHAVWQHSFLTQADLFAYGMIVAVLRIEAEDGRLRRSGGWLAAALAGVVVVPCVVIPATWSGHLDYQLYQEGMALACACLLALTVLPQGRTVLVAALERRAVLWLGLISYSIYLWHVPVIQFLHRHGLAKAGTRGIVLGGVLALAVIVALSSITSRWVELPALRRKSRAAREPGPAVGAVVPVGAGE
jgi:peptidoglycan/LPS O-acetylase OafA/YrhL